ncbi:adhesin [Fibrisoma montanum]|uniref:adhesin n=1 Tax=Fibrisoma montanum TaxID=2305895 RepID=UPI0018F6B349|nr:adhesin [Fibrisoma montanum]
MLHPANLNHDVDVLDDVLMLTPDREGADYDDTGSGATSGYGEDDLDDISEDDLDEDDLDDDDLDEDLDDDVDDDLDDDGTTLRSYY